MSEAATIRGQTKGGSYTRVDRPAKRSKTGIPEGIPRTAAATRYIRRKETPKSGVGSFAL